MPKVSVLRRKESDAMLAQAVASLALLRYFIAAP